MNRTIKKSSLKVLVNLAAFLPCSQANGPGERAVVWVQGCRFNCGGCFNPAMQKIKRRQLISPVKLAERILANQNIEGVTFSGGEPFLQAEALALLGEILAAQGLNILVFTGYTWAELKNSREPAKEKLLSVADLLVAGRYLKNRPGSGYLQSSANQELVFLTDKLKFHPEIINGTHPLLEFVIDAEGNIVTTGIMRLGEEN